MRSPAFLRSRSGQISADAPEGPPLRALAWFEQISEARAAQVEHLICAVLDLPCPRRHGDDQRSEGKARAQSRDPPIATPEKKRKRAATGEGKKKPRKANETTGKWFSFADELEQLVVEKSMLADLKRRVPDGEVLPAPRDAEHVIHQEYFGRGLGFPLHSFVRGLLCFFGCQVHHTPPPPTHTQWSSPHSESYHFL